MQQTLEEEIFRFRWQCFGGDLVITWAKDAILIDGRLATEREQKKVESWAKKHNLHIEGPLTEHCKIHADMPKIKKALEELVKEQVGEAGYLLYGVDRLGRGKILKKEDVQIPELKQVVKAAQTKGG